MTEATKLAFVSPAFSTLFKTSHFIQAHGARIILPSTKVTQRRRHCVVYPRSSIAEESSNPSSAVTSSPEFSTQRVFETYEWRGYNINYMSEGPENGKPVLFIHGFGASINHWRKNIPAMLQAGDTHVYAIDLLGLGASEKPNPSEVTYSIELWASLIVDFVKSMNKEQKWSFVGNSIGSLISLSAADQLGQDNVRCCSLMNCAGGMVSFRYSELNPIQRIVFYLFNSLLFNQYIGRYLFEYIRKPEKLSNVLKQIYVDQSAITDELVNILSTPAFDKGACDVFLAIINGEPGPKPEDLLKRLEWCPILTLWGADDPWTPLNTGYRPGIRFLEYHNGLILKPIPNAGHCIHDEVPDIVNAEVVPFVQSPSFRE